MEALIGLYVFAFIFGLIIGSFLNVLVDRIPRNESIIKTRSHCEHCRRTLSWWDLIPLFSYLYLHGRCRYCHKHISFFYPVVEVLTGFLFMFTTYMVVPDIMSLQTLSPYSILVLLYYLFLFSCLITIVFTDFKYRIIPFYIVLAAAAATFLHILVLPNFLTHIFSALGVFGFFLFLFLITRGRGLGFGDVVFAFLMGLILGFPKIIVGLYIAFLTGAVISVILVWIGKKKLRGGSIPFGPFLVSGTIISIFWGELIIGKVIEYLLR